LPGTTAAPSAGNTTLTATINPADYQFQVPLSEGGSLYWKVEGEIIEFGIEVLATGWLGFGPSSNGGMIGSDVIFAWVDSTGPHVEDRFITDKSTLCPGVCLDTDPAVGGTDDILEFNGNENNGVTQIKWRRKLVTGDVKADNNIVVGGEQMIVYAWNPTIKQVIQHNSDTRYQAVINFSSGGIVSISTQANEVAHGLLMFFAWALFVPVGTVIARYLKKYKWWFNVHRLINAFAMMLVLIAFIIAVDFSSSHFYNLHTILGLIVVILGLSQPVIGTVADRWFNPDRESTPIFPDMTHWVIGYISLLAALANIAIGINEYGGEGGLLIAYIIYGGLVASVLFAFGVYHYIGHRSVEAKH